MGEAAVRQRDVDQVTRLEAVDRSERREIRGAMAPDPYRAASPSKGVSG
jgi:hypothetical protein